MRNPCRECDVELAVKGIHSEWGGLCDPCRLRLARESLGRFLAHQGECWEWIDPGNNGAACNDLRRLERLLKEARCP